MDYQVVWTEPALKALRDILSYIAQDNPAAAERLGNEILARVDVLVNHPFAGTVYRRRAAREVRELVCRRYRIFFRVSEERRLVEILTVWHGARRDPEITE